MASTKINSSLAKVSPTGQVTCLLCQCPVKSANVWTAHVNGKQHREKLNALKAGKDIKSKNGNLHISAGQKRPINSSGDDQVLKKNRSSTDKTLPSDFFDSRNSNAKVVPSASKSHTVKVNNGVDRPPRPLTPAPAESVDESVPWSKPTTVTDDSAPTTAIPEGFFDDAEKDAKVRQVDPKELEEEEWLRFQREVQQVEHNSEQIVEEQEEVSNVERTIEEIDKQIDEWSRVNSLQERKEKIVVSVVGTDIPVDMEEDEDNTVDEDIDLEAIYDWRSKQAWT